MFKLFLLSLLVISFSSNASVPFEIQEYESPYPGYLYGPKKEGDYPAIIFLHGSDGGNGDYYKSEGFNESNVGENSVAPQIARYYASQGFVTYALCYFDCKKNHKGFENYPPDNFNNIDIYEHVYKPLKWLKNSKFVNGSKVILWGGSKGAELSILLASHLSKLNKEDNQAYVVPDAVMSLSPSDRIGLASLKEDDGTLKTLYGEPSYRFKESVFKAWTPIDIEYYQGPLMINYMTQDPLWGYLIQPVVLYYKYLSIDITPLYFQIEEDLKFDDVYESYQKAPTDFLGQNFINFNFEGHVFVDQTKYEEAQKIQNFINAAFIHQVIKQ
ncbi:hypothetical protein HBN50_06790 [Halobacteriovorax sp. GB3]|uniref:hypothetical protein n=1 Tax=Halobacteriovorax sp. GB3 TaxID=2719615 RepID=UPI0023603FAB|nr:hypothetical protein [Halobacteriovorax sp. GB3]MDD0852793.1 hypothetical protein [Halobacteriovorax sp. GB3]